MASKKRKRGQPEKASVKKILTAIEGTGGLKTAIATKLGVHRMTVFNYEKKYETVRQAIEDETEKILDKAESVLFVRVQEGDEDTCKWILARKGKNRGYSEKIDTEQKIEGEVKLKYEEVPTEIAQKIGKELARKEDEDS